MKSDRIALFGGSFNPPHRGHVHIAEAAAKQYHLDEVLWIPNSISPHKTHFAGADPHHRLEMTRLVILGFPSFTVSDMEIKRGGVSYTIDTIEAVKKVYEESDLFLLIGGDSFLSLDTFHTPNRIRALVHFLVYPRENEDIVEDELRQNDGLIVGDFLNYSSTDIRYRIARQMPIDDLVSPAIAAYIKTHQLYQ